MAQPAVALNSLAELYRAQGKYAAAEPVYERPLAICEKPRAPDHRNVATVLENVAEFYEKSGRRDEAGRLEEQAKGIRAINNGNGRRADGTGVGIAIPRPTGRHNRRRNTDSDAFSGEAWLGKAFLFKSRINRNKASIGPCARRSCGTGHERRNQ